MDRIYLDNAATTQVAPGVRAEMDKIYSGVFGNPSSIHSFGQEARQIVEDSRSSIAKFLKCQSDELIFTSGGSESDNLAIRGLANSQQPTVNRKSHIITSAAEHHAVLHTIADLEKAGVIEATYLKPDHSGLITKEMVEKEIKKNTLLISLMYVNNETGVITPIEEIGAMIEKVNIKQNNHRIYFHTDAVQAVEHLDISPKTLKVDLMTITAHKFHGPKGIGLLYVKDGTPIKSQVTGGEQEFGIRAGTENVAGIAGMAKAIKLVNSQQSTDNSIESLRDKSERDIQLRIPNTIINGRGAKRAPHISNISFLNAEGESIILNLDILGIAVSSGSACTSRSLEPSHVLTAMGVPPEKAHGSIRFSLSRYTTKKEIDKVVEVLPGIINKLRLMSPIK
jgi:cysteine desulfurase